MVDPNVEIAHLAFYVLVGFVVSVACTPVGISGAFLLVPFQLSVLGLDAVSVSSTALVFNIISAPSGILRYRRDGRIDGRLARLVLIGSVPAVVVGAWLRVNVVSDPRSFKVLAGLVLGLLAVRVVVGSRKLVSDATATDNRPIRSGEIVALSAAVGLAGGMYGIGGGSLLAPLLVSVGVAVGEVAGAALVATLGSSIAAVGAFLVFGAGAAGIEPYWALAVCFGVGGIAGSYLGARAHRWLPPVVLTWMVAVLAGTTGAFYLAQGLGG